MSAVPSLEGDRLDTVAAALDAPFSIVCLSPQEWDVALPTNRQQIMRRAGLRGHRVLFVETGDFLGRRLTAGSLRSDLRPRQVAPNVVAVRAPNLAPWGHRFRAAAELNARLTAALVGRWTAHEQVPAVLWIYDPCAAPMVGRSGERLAVYDCVDDYAEQAGGDARKRALLEVMDRRSAEVSKVVFATASPLALRHAATNPNTHLVRNVGDFAHFSPAADASYRASEVRDLPRPVVGFVGNFLDQKVDLELLERAASDRPGWTFLLVGPSRDETQDALARLAALPNVRVTGGRPYAEVPRYVAAFDVAVIPYRANDYTQSCFPLKTFEYLAAGKPVVATGLPELAGMGPDVVLTEGADGFVRATEAALTATGDVARGRRQRIAAANTWEVRTERLLSLTAAALEEVPDGR